MHPQRIALITPSVRLLGARRSLFALARALDRDRFEPHVVCPSAGGLEEECNRAGIQTQVLWLPAWRKGKYWPLIPLQLWRLRSWLRTTGIALMHANEIYPTPHAVFVGRPLRIPTITHMRLSVNERLIRNYHLRKANRVICVSRRASDPFRVWSEYDETVRVIYNGVDVDEWRRAAGDIESARASVRKELGLPADTYLIGHLGLISRRKQQHMLVEAARRIGGGCRNWHVVIVGDPSPNEQDYGERILAAVREAGLEDRITIQPFRRDVEPVFAALDVNLLISSDEGFGRVAIEAAALGVPTIGTRVGGIPEVVKDHETGLLIHVDDTDDLTHAIERLAGDEGLRRRLGETARARVENEFTIQVHAQNIMKLYDEVLSETSVIKRRV